MASISVFEGTTVAVQGIFYLFNALLNILYVPSKAFKTFNQPPPQSRKRVVVVGASFAGLWCQRNLCEEFDLTVVDYKKYFEYTPGILRVFVDLPHLRKITGPIPSSRSKFICGEALGIDPDDKLLRVKLENGKTRNVPFDFLLIGTGSTYSGSIRASKSESTLRSREATWERECKKLKEARSVLIIGGGPVGVELAGEILTRYPDKKVVITDRTEELCAQFFRPKTRTYAKKWLEERGAEVVLGDPIDGKFPDLKIDEKGCTLRSGRRLTGDIVYKCMGFRPCTEWVKDSLPPGCMDKGGYLKVNDHLQLDVCGKTVFAMGDCMIHSSNEVKLGHTAEVNAHLVAENVRRMAKRKPLLPYPKGVVGASKTPRIYALSLGKYDGSLGFNSLVVNGSMAAFFKWMVEWTKILACREVLVGIAFWQFSDITANFLGRTLVRTTSVDDDKDE
ncbi:hypothetical protein AAMO2058_000338000 [Amorphochlora amoebiformis]